MIAPVIYIPPYNIYIDNNANNIENCYPKYYTISILYKL